MTYCLEQEVLEENEPKCVKFNYSREAWVISYEDASGTVRYSYRGFGLAKKDYLGNVMSDEQVHKDMVLKKIKAMAAWNASDKSSRPRLTLPQHPDGPDAALLA